MTNIYESQSEYIASILLKEGRVRLTGPDGSVLWLLMSGFLGNDERQGMLISYEQKGCFWHDLSRPLTKYGLTAAGFPLAQANFVASLVNDVLACIRSHHTPPNPS